MVAPGSVVPPGRLIPANQLWAGNPVEFVKHLDIGELWANYSLSYVNTFLGAQIKQTYTSWPSNYLLKKSSKDDLGNSEYHEKFTTADTSNQIYQQFMP